MKLAWINLIMTHDPKDNMSIAKLIWHMYMQIVETKIHFPFDIVRKKKGYLVFKDLLFTGSLCDGVIISSF